MTEPAPRPRIVLDASAALAILRAETDRAAIDVVIDRHRAAGGRLLVPDVFWLEVANGLVRRFISSPNQVVEHVAMALEESAKAVKGEPSKFPRFPSLVHPVLRSLFLKRVLRRGRFSSARTNKAMDPLTGPGTPAQGRARLQAAMDAYAQACTERSRTSAMFTSTIFGPVSLVDYGRFQALHTLHHRRQLPA